MDRPSNEEQDRNGLIPRPERCDVMSASQQNYNGVRIFTGGTLDYGCMNNHEDMRCDCSGHGRSVNEECRGW